MNTGIAYPEDETDKSSTDQRLRSGKATDREMGKPMPSAVKPASPSPPSSGRRLELQESGKEAADGEQFTGLRQGECQRAAWSERRGRSIIAVQRKKESHEQFIVPHVRTAAAGIQATDGTVGITGHGLQCVADIVLSWIT